MQKYFLFLFIIISLIVCRVNAQQCLSGGCTSFSNEYPSNGAPYTPPSSWQVLINPTTGSPALMNGGNWTRFNVIAGNTYEWTYCEAYGGVSTSWDAQLTLFNNTNLSTPICFSTDVCGTTGNAPYISWTATFTGVARILTTAYISGVGCQSNSGTYNKLAYRQFSAGCTTPGTPASATGTPTGQTTANLSWTAGSPMGSPTITYYWVVGTSSSVTYGSGVAQGTTTGTTASTSALTCGTTYYLRVYANTSCNGTNSGYITSSSFTTSACSGSSVYGIDVSHFQGSINWPQVHTSGKVFAFAKATEGVTFDDDHFSTYMPAGISAGMVMGAYHVARPTNNTAAAEASHFLNIAGSYIGPGYLPPALDLEPAYIESLTPSVLSAWIQAWMTAVQNATGISPIIYCTHYDAANYINSSLNIYGLWIANYETNPTVPPTNIGVWTTWEFNQYSAIGIVPGITGSVDLDVFNGDATTFNNLIYPPTSLADLIITAGTYSASPTTVIAGSTITAFASEDNIGNAIAASGTVVGLWLSSSSTLNTTNSIYLGSITGFPAISAGSNSLIYQNTVTIPSSTSAGSYYLFFWADGGSCGSGASCITCSGSVIESNECNNFASVPITVTCTVPGAVTVNGGGTFCNSAVLNATGGSGGTIYWQGTTSNGTNTTTPSTSQTVTASGTYYFRANSSCGWGTQGSATVTINSTPTLSVSPTNQNVVATAGNASFTVSNTGCGTMSYTSSVNTGSNWLSIVSGGSGGNSGTINISFSQNTDCNQRIGTIAITASGATGSPISVTVTQAGNSTPTLSVTPSNQNVSASAGNTSFNVLNTACGNMNYTSSVTSGSSWLSITGGGSGGNTGTINVSYTQNSDCNQRIGTITITASGATGSPISVTVTQAGNSTPTLSVTPSNQNVSASAGNTSFNVLNTACGTLNYTSQINPGSEWLTITSGGTGSNSGTINVSYTQNTGSSLRVGTITVTAAGATGSPVSITVTQSATSPIPILSVEPYNQNVTYQTGTCFFNVINTGSGTMNYTSQVNPGSEWLSITSGGTGGNNGTLTVTYSENTGTTQRIGTITVTASGATGSPVSVTVTQEAPSLIPILNVEPTNQNVNYFAGTSSFDVSNTGNGTMSYSSQVISGSNWLSIISGGTGGNSGSLKLYYTQNNDLTQRVGIITVTANGAIGSPAYVTVTQDFFTSVLDLSKHKIKIFPNPTCGIVNIESDKPFDQLTDITIVNLVGQIIGIYSINTEQKTQIDFSLYPEGIYFLLITSGKESVHVKIIRGH